VRHGLVISRARRTLAGAGAGRCDGSLLGQRRRHPPADRRRPHQEPALTPQHRDLDRLAAGGAIAAGPPPLPVAQADSTAVEVDRIISSAGTVSLAGRQVLAAEILAGRRVAIRIEPATLCFFDPDTRQLLRTRPDPLSDQQTARLQRTRPAGPPPRPTTEPVTAQRRASNTGVIVAGPQCQRATLDPC
jgi:hypothetical protein